MRRDAPCAGGRRPRAELTAHPLARPALEVLAELGAPAAAGLGAARAAPGGDGGGRLQVFAGLGWLLGDGPVPVLVETDPGKEAGAIAWAEVAAIAGLMRAPPKPRAAFARVVAETAPAALLPAFGLPGSRDASGLLRRLGVRAGPASMRAASEGVFARARRRLASADGDGGMSAR